MEEPVEGAHLLSARVRRQFGADWFNGSVTEVWKCNDDGEVYAHVQYEDGDEEDLYVREAEEAVAAAAAAEEAALPRALGFEGAGSYWQLPGSGAGGRKRKGNALMTDFVNPGGKTRCVARVGALR